MKRLFFYLVICSLTFSCSITKKSSLDRKLHHTFKKTWKQTSKSDRKLMLDGGKIVVIYDTIKTKN